MGASRFVVAAVVSALVGLVAITLYLVVERAIAAPMPVMTCLQQLLQWDASNGYGAAAFDGGWPTAGIGLAMDTVVSLVWGFVFASLYVSAPIVRQNVVVAGLCFGAIVMAVMLYVIVPIGHAVRMTSTISHVINVLVAHTVFFGLPIALTLRAMLAPGSPAQPESPRAA